MPIENIQHSIHIRRKKNQLVWNNLARLWEIGAQAKSQQELLDRLHPWNAPISLRFENKLPILLGIIGLILILLFWLAPAHWALQLCLLLGGLLIFGAFLCYESSRPIDNAIQELEQQALALKYQLAFNSIPRHEQIIFQPVRFIAQIKQLFPLFQQGNLSNDIRRYALTHWQDEQGQTHQVMLFEYRYVSEIQVQDQNGNKMRLKEIEKFLWGAIVFGVELQGLALSSQRKSFAYPYTQPWHTSDIQINRQLNIYGTDTHQMARQLTPAVVLKLANFLNAQPGDLLFHPEQKILCYIGSQNLFQASSTYKTIQDISALRGHLRTFKLPYLEQLQRHLLQLL